MSDLSELLAFLPIHISKLLVLFAELLLCRLQVWGHIIRHYINAQLGWKLHKPISLVCNVEISLLAL